MDTLYQEPARSIPVKKKVDVLVAGGGVAGVAAAVNAARQGADTLLVEMSGMMGGVSTSGMMSHFTGDVHSRFYLELLDRMSALNEHTKERTRFIDTEKLRKVYLDLLGEAGVAYRMYTFVCDVIMDGQRVKGLVTESKGGREAFLAKVVIDATGDGDVAALAGVPYHKGRALDGRMQPVTTMFKIAGVDFSRAVFPAFFEDEIMTPKGELQSLASRHLPEPAGHVLLYPSPVPGIVTCNMTNCTDIDGTDPDQLTRGETVCRSQIEPIIRFLREFAPGYEHCYLISSASMLGVRETRHIEGAYQLSGEDILGMRPFDDWVVRGAMFNFDVHNLDGAGLDVTGSQKHFPEEVRYTIPYRCLLPKGVDGLLLAGRSISGSHLAHSNYRAMPICVAMGEAAGIAASLASRQDLVPAAVLAQDIQAGLWPKEEGK